MSGQLKVPEKPRKEMLMRKISSDKIHHAKGGMSLKRPLAQSAASVSVGFFGAIAILRQRLWDRFRDLNNQGFLVHRSVQ